MKPKKRGMNPEQAEKLRVKKWGGVGSKLRVVRVRKGLSQSDLCEKSGVPKKTIQSYEQSRNAVDNAKLSTICKLSETLDCKISDIIESEELREKFDKVK